MNFDPLRLLSCLGIVFMITGLIKENVVGIVIGFAFIVLGCFEEQR